MKKIVIVVALLVAGLFGLVIPSTVFATDPICDKLSGDARIAAGCGTETSVVGNTAVNIINIFLYVVGVVAVIMIIYGGFLFMTSSGDAGKVAKAKSVLLYAVIGLVVTVLAYAIVKFVIGQVS